MQIIRTKNKDAYIFIVFALIRCQLQDTATVASGECVAGGVRNYKNYAIYARIYAKKQSLILPHMMHSFGIIYYVYNTNVLSA